MLEEKEIANIPIRPRHETTFDIAWYCFKSCAYAQTHGSSRIYGNKWNEKWTSNNNTKILHTYNSKNYTQTDTHTRNRMNKVWFVRACPSKCPEMRSCSYDNTSTIISHKISIYANRMLFVVVMAVFRLACIWVVLRLCRFCFRWFVMDFSCMHSSIEFVNFDLLWHIGTTNSTQTHTRAHSRTCTAKVRLLAYKICIRFGYAL